MLRLLTAAYGPFRVVPCLAQESVAIGGGADRPLAQQIERLSRQHDVAVLAALRLLDTNDLLCAVDMLDLQPHHLAGTQSAAIAEAQENASLEAAGNGQSRRLVSSGLMTRGIFCGSRR